MLSQYYSRQENVTTPHDELININVVDLAQAITVQDVAQANNIEDLAQANNIENLAQAQNVKDLVQTNTAKDLAHANDISQAGEVLPTAVSQHPVEGLAASGLPAGGLVTTPAPAQVVDSGLPAGGLVTTPAPA